jgi:surfactin family lipopeptide synthetase A
VKIWEDILGVADISITDNFFELGGDSIKAVQIVSRLSEKGISLRAKDILTYHTIAQISPHATITDGKPDGGQGQKAAEGEKELTPIEQCFFDQEHKNPHYYNQSALFELKRTMDKALLEKAFTILIQHHDGLRLNYDPVGRRLFYNEKHLKADFVIGAFGPGMDGEDALDMEEICRRISSGFNIYESLLVKAALIDQTDARGWLFITIHHLVTDGISWRILMEDLYTTYRALEMGETIKLPPKTATLKEWVSQLQEYSSSGLQEQERNYWATIEATTFHVPREFQVNDWTVGSLDSIHGTLGKESTAFLLKEANNAYNTDTPILLNTALILTLKEWIGLDKCIVEQESHGRFLETVDVSRTIGWFTTVYPVILESREGPISGQIKSVKEQIRKIPNHGIGYGLWKYLRLPSINAKEGMTGIRFNYLGQFDREMNNELFSYTGFPVISDSAPANKATAELDFNLMVIGGCLHFKISYNKYAYRTATINWLGELFRQNIEKVLDHIRNERELHFTPSDFDAAGLDQDELDALFTQ